MGLGAPSTGPTLGCHRGSDSKEFETRCIIVEPQADVKPGRGVGAGETEQGCRWRAGAESGGREPVSGAGGDTAPLPSQRAVGRASSHCPPPQHVETSAPPLPGQPGGEGCQPLPHHEGTAGRRWHLWIPSPEKTDLDVLSAGLFFPPCREGGDGRRGLLLLPGNQEPQFLLRSESWNCSHDSGHLTDLGL